MSGEGLLADRPAAFDAPTDVPMVTFGEAEAIGVQMHDRLEEALGSAPMTREDLAWGDLVQFVLRKAFQAVLDRTEQQENS